MKTLKINITIILLCIVAVTVRAQKPVLKKDQNTPEYICPGFAGYYTLVDDVYGDKIVKIDWTVTGGSFSMSTEQTTLTTVASNEVTVYWKNVLQSEGGGVPVGTLKAEVLYKSMAPKDAPITQKIRSLNGAKPPALSSSTGTVIDYGTQKFEVYLSKAFEFVTDGDWRFGVTKFEWTLPPGWKDSKGNTGTFESSDAGINVITDELSEGTIKVRGINDCSIMDERSAYSEITIKRKFSYTTYPTSVKGIIYGVDQTFNYAVTDVDGCTFEWNYPPEWSLVSGANSHSVILSKSACATSADVKVRVLDKKGNASNWYMCPNTTLSLPEVTFPSKIEQLQAVNVSIDIPASIIESFTLAGDGVTFESSETANMLKCKFLSYGNIDVTFSVSLKGCNNSVLTFKKTIYISKVYLRINGPDTLGVDEMGTYTLTPRELITTPISWTVPTEVLMIHSGDGTDKVNIAPANWWIVGDYRIEAHVNSETIYKTIHLGGAGVTNIVGPTSVGVNSSNTFYAQPYLDCEYEWTVNPYSGVKSMSWNDYACTIVFKYLGDYTINCRLLMSQVGGVDQNIPASLTVKVVSGISYIVSNSGKILMIRPNDIEERAILKNGLKKYEIYNQITGLLVAKGRVETLGGSIDCMNVPDGFYILRIENDLGLYETYKIVF